MAARLRVVKEPPANHPDIDKIIRSMPLEFLMCRDWGHAWAAYTASKSRREIINEVVCNRCGSFKIRTQTLRGFIVKSHYRYAEGYLIAGWSRLSPDDRARMRRALTNAILNDQEIEVLENA
jgi:hypothetical protein